jgi:hypothetical protein
VHEGREIVDMAINHKEMKRAFRKLQEVAPTLQPYELADYGEAIVRETLKRYCLLMANGDSLDTINRRIDDSILKGMEPPNDRNQSIASDP